MNFKLITLIVLLSTLVVLAACQPFQPVTHVEPATLAASQTVDMVEFTSATAQFSLKYPIGWVAAEDVEGGVLTIANTETALAHFSTGQVDTGDFVLNVGFIPATFLELIGVRLGTTPESLLQSIMPILRAKRDNATVGEIEVISLTDARAAALVMVSDGQGEGQDAGAFMVFPAAEGVIAFVSAMGSPAEFEDFSEIALTVAATVEFNGDAETLWVAMLGAE